ncbi:uncharacterized protein ASPGLDRAFT_138465 [Aspergillus glaucus CBS 516.65]|uniref:Uncharacterized protein n=1 Tax=Aspergillus glaucus CBS 516.65 TaxID=1160497 RepID=A0A1L9V432_ASPGL|nr:hypothetical protein ASPGLDRAFT_138465 [Aspergillus glaucus CBS 516.65]OJJ78666.1 hypothetical protein ASPGLDRAFT_138465 [Aspergillus glaucus CBS 516.65]
MIVVRNQLPLHHLLWLLHHPDPVNNSLLLAPRCQTNQVRCSARSPPRKRLPETFTERNLTVTALWDLIKRRQVVHIRGTPATGKSTLAHLLARHVSILEPGLEVYHLCWPESFDYLSKSAPYSYLLNNLARRSQDRDDWMDIDGLLIIDEAQASYRYSSLWNDLIKFLEPGFGLRVALFSSYGSASALVQEASTLTPLKLNSNQRISLKRSAEHPDLCLLLSHDEFHDLVYRRCQSYGDSQPFRPSAELIEHLFGMTQGHAAASACVLEILSESKELRCFRRRALPIPLVNAIKFIQTDKFLKAALNYAKFARGLVSEEVLQKMPDLVKFLQTAVSQNFVSGDPAPGTPLELCYRNGWLQAELSSDDSTVYVFASPLHRRCTEFLLPQPSVPFPRSLYPTLKAFSFSVLHMFSSVALNIEAPLSDSAVSRPLEAGYQDEYYRASFELLGNLYLKSEWAGTQQTGWVDFAIPSEKWIVECVRDGDKPKEHIERFQTTGKYRQWISNQEVQEFILLDFRRSIPRKQRGIDWLFHVVFAEDFSSYTVYDSDCKVVPGESQIALLR